METIQIQLPTELLQRLQPYQHDLAKLLELGLHSLEANAQPVTDAELPPRVLGLHEGQGWISDDFTDPLPDSFWVLS